MSQLEHADPDLTSQDKLQEQTVEIPSLPNEEPAEPEHSKQLNAELEAFIRELESEVGAENKLQKTILFMEQALSQGKTPHFKSFWGARDLSLQLFKENISPALRSLLWQKYTELSKEARRLKELLDEQSAFAVEQIEMAIQALETELNATEQSLQSGEEALVIECPALNHNGEFYTKTQLELNRLNIQASRINALRKELIKTEMRIRKKNQFFQRLSVAGDRVFPRRKELIQQVSQHFIQDVDQFIAKNFDGKPLAPLYALREQIKALQSLAKVLTLNSTAFAHTRLRLSECWDKIKLLDKERKQEHAQKKTIYKQNMDTVLEHLENVNKEIQEGALSPNTAFEKLDEISHFMRGVELGREEVVALKDRIQQLRQPLIEKQHEEEKLRSEQEKERQQVRRQMLLNLKQEIEELLQAAQNDTVEMLLTKRSALIEKINSSPLQKSEKQELERSLKQLKDIITEKKEQAILALSSDDRETLQQLQEVLQQRKERYQQLKEEVETLRKATGSSGLDFEKAIAYQHQLAETKERLEKSKQEIEEVQDRIDSFSV